MLRILFAILLGIAMGSVTPARADTQSGSAVTGDAGVGAARLDGGVVKTTAGSDAGVRKAPLDAGVAKPAVRPDAGAVKTTAGSDAGVAKTIAGSDAGVVKTTAPSDADVAGISDAGRPDARPTAAGSAAAGSPADSPSTTPVDAGVDASAAGPLFAPIPIPIPIPMPMLGADSPGEAGSAIEPVDAVPEPPVVTAPPAPSPSASEVVKVILGLLAILVLAYLAGHPKVQEIEELLGISQVVTAGFPFVLLGLLAHHPSIGVLSDPVLDQIRPFIPLGLGWIGFTIGFRFDVRQLEVLPRGIGPALLLTSALPFGGIVGACGLMLLIAGGFGEGTFLRDAIVLGTAGIVGVRAATPGATRAIGDRIAPLRQMQEGAAMIGLVVLSAFWRPYGGGWQLPATAWIFVTLGMGTALGAVIYAVLNSFKEPAEVTVVMLGSICLSAGMASYLRLSPIAVCFLAGALIVNFPGTWKEQVRLTLVRIERPVYLVFLVVAGAQWSPGAWEGWVLLLLFVAARFVGKILGVFFFRQQQLGELNDEEQTRIAIAPMGALAIAIVVNAQGLYTGYTVSWMVTAIIGGAIATEIVGHVLMNKILPVVSPAKHATGTPPAEVAPRAATPLPFRLPSRAASEPAPATSEPAQSTTSDIPTRAKSPTEPPEVP